MTTQLSLYNDVCLLCGERFLATLSDNVESRRLLDQVWLGAVNYCLSRGQWYFAMRTQMIDYDPSIEPDFGYLRAFDKPTDWIRTSGMCSDEYFNMPIERIVDEAGYWYCDFDTIYVRYVSNATTYGNDLNKWPEDFREYVASYLATRIVKALSGSDEKEKYLLEVSDKRLKVAKGNAAMQDSVKFPAPGNWVKSRSRWPNRYYGSQGNIPT